MLLQFLFNLQRDVIGVIDSAGTEVVKYTYNAWGKVFSATGALSLPLWALRSHSVIGGVSMTVLRKILHITSLICYFSAVIF